ncbi:MAG: ribonuclease HII [Pseudomonadales bacterium]
MRLFENHALPVLTAGVDEVGRGPLAGPVMAAAVILDPARPIRGLKDSKALSAAQREGLAEQIRERALCWALGRAEVAEIDAINILRASHLAMQRAVQALSHAPELIFVDGHLLPAFAAPAVALVGGDALMPAISAAGIIAKVARDAEMARWALCYPGYGLERHKGYATAAHLQALTELGPTPLHRQSFAPVRTLQLNRELF